MANGIISGAGITVFNVSIPGNLRKAITLAGGDPSIMDVSVTVGGFTDGYGAGLEYLSRLAPELIQILKYYLRYTKNVFS